MAKQQYWEVQTYTVCDGWINTWADGNTGKPMVFSSREAAERDLKEFLADTAEEAAIGNLEEAFSAEDYRIVRTGGKQCRRS